jgi:hypothetical protein
LEILQRFWRLPPVQTGRRASNAVQIAEPENTNLDKSESSRKPHFNRKGQTECLKLGRLNCKRRHREKFNSLILTQPERFSLQ